MGIINGKVNDHISIVIVKTSKFIEASSHSSFFHFISVPNVFILSKDELWADIDPVFFLFRLPPFLPCQPLPSLEDKLPEWGRCAVCWMCDGGWRG